MIKRFSTYVPRRTRELPAHGIALSIWLGVSLAFSSELKLQLIGPTSLVRRSIAYHCSSPVRAGLLSNTFEVEYVDDGTNTLAILPVSGHSVILVGVPASSGAQYTGGHYVWKDSGQRGASLVIDGAKEYRCGREDHN